MKLNSKQQLRLDIISQYLSGQIFSLDACLALNISSRQFSRVVKAFREDGINSLIHGNRGREPCNKTKYSTLTKIFNLYRGRYSGINLIHFIEKLKENHFDELDKIPCYSTIRNRLVAQKLIKLEKIKRSSSKRMRKRYEKEGLMIQIDEAIITGLQVIILFA